MFSSLKANLSEEFGILDPLRREDVVQEPSGLWSFGGNDMAVKHYVVPSNFLL